MLEKVNSVSPRTKAGVTQLPGRVPASDGAGGNKIKHTGASISGFLLHYKRPCMLEIDLTFPFS